MMEMCQFDFAGKEEKEKMEKSMTIEISLYRVNEMILFDDSLIIVRL